MISIFFKYGEVYSLDGEYPANRTHLPLRKLSSTNIPSTLTPAGNCSKSFEGEYFLECI